MYLGGSELGGVATWALKLARAWLKIVGVVLFLTSALSSPLYLFFIKD